MVDWLVTFGWLKLLLIFAAVICGPLLAIFIWGRFRSKQRPPELSKPDSSLSEDTSHSPHLERQEKHPAETPEELLEAALDALKKDRFAAALDLLNLLASQASESWQVFFLRSQCCLGLGDPGQAQADLERCRALAENKDQKTLDELENLINELTENQKQWGGQEGWRLHQEAVKVFNAGDLGKAEALLRRLINKIPSGPGKDQIREALGIVHRQHAAKAYSAEKYEEAERLLRQAIEVAPKATWQNKAQEELAIVLTNKAFELFYRKPGAMRQVEIILQEAVSLAPQVVDNILGRQEEEGVSSSSSLTKGPTVPRSATRLDLRDLYKSRFKPPHAPQPQPKVKSSPSPRFLPQLRFSAFYPERVKPKDTGKIVAYAHLETVAREVAREAARRLDLSAEVRLKAASEPSRHPVPKESVIKVTPDIPGLRFDIPEAQLTLWEDKQSVEFRFRPDPTEVDKVCSGWLYFWLEGVLLADVRVSIAVVVEEAPDLFREALAEANARPYRFIFPSYSHEDGAVVARLEAYAQAFGDEYVRDVHKLRSGQHWHPELIGFIKRANVFQLFWSEKSAGSTYVREEWQEALEQRRLRPDPHFLRPVYWTEKPAPIPAELQEIHFARIPYSVLTE